VKTRREDPRYEIRGERQTHVKEREDAGKDMSENGSRRVIENEKGGVRRISDTAKSLAYFA